MMKKYIKIIILLLLPLYSCFIHAQQDPQFTFYTYNTTTVNPAYAGSKGHLSIIGLNRTQWVGLDGAPTTQTLGIDSPIGKNLGGGLVIINDELGPSNEFYVDGNISYTLKLNELGKKLSFGVKAGGRLLNVDFSKGITQNPDIVFQNNINSEFFPTIGAGLYYHTNKSFLGVAVPNFLAQEQFDEIQQAVAVERLHYFFIGGTVFDLSYNWKLKPSFFVRLVSGAPAIADISTSVLYNERFSLGVSYRWDDSVSGLIGFQVSSSFSVGYAYDLTTTTLGDFNAGTHEFFIRFDLKSIEQKIKSPRFF